MSACIRYFASFRAIVGLLLSAGAVEAAQPKGPSIRQKLQAKILESAPPPVAPKPEAAAKETADAPVVM